MADLPCADMRLVMFDTDFKTRKLSSDVLFLALLVILLVSKAVSNKKAP